MNYYNASQLRNKLLILKETNLIKSPEWVINEIVILPAAEESLLAYIAHIGVGNFKEWIATGFDQDYFYKIQDIYTHAHERKLSDDLTLYALLKYQKSILNIEYKCELIINLIASEEVSPFRCSESVWSN
jgi:hypothetical protein